MFADTSGNGIINVSGDLWKAQRKAGMKFFSGTNLELMVAEVLPEAYKRIETKLLKHATDGTIVDMQAVFLDFTSFVMGHMAYDVRCSTSSTSTANMGRWTLIQRIPSAKHLIMLQIRLADVFRIHCTL